MTLSSSKMKVSRSCLSMSSWSKELVAHRQPTSGTEGCGDSLGRGKVPQAKSPGAPLLFRDSPRACRSPDPAPPERYSLCVGRSLFKDSSDRGPGVKVISDHLS